MPESNKARYKAHCTVTCPLCDRRHEITSYHADRAWAEKWLEWARGRYHLCPECEDKRRWASKKMENV